MNLYEPPPRTVYLPAFQDGGIHSHFALRTSVSPLSIADDVRRAIQDELKGVRVAKVTTLTDQLNASIANERLVASVAGGFGATGAALAGVGLFGLLAYSVARRPARSAFVSHLARRHVMSPHSSAAARSVSCAPV